MAHALPVAKLASLLVKTLAKPLSKRIKHECSRYQTSQRLLVGIGQASHRLTSRMTIWSAGYKVRSITPLEEEKALQTGAEFVGETFILLVSGGTVIWEYNRSKEKERKIDEKRRQVADDERRALQAKLRALDVRVQALELAASQKDERLSTIILGSSKQAYKAPDPNQIVPIDGDDETVNRVLNEHVAAAATKAAQTSTTDNNKVSENTEKEATIAPTVNNSPSWWSLWRLRPW